MEQSFDARGNAATDGIDARGNPAVDGIDARGIEPQAPVPACPECGTALRAAGPGRRPVYCGRACSSRAYRKRRTEDQQDAIADALIASRVEIPAGVDGGAQELLELAAGVQRIAARFLEQLDQARQGGADPGGSRALELLESSVTGATQRLLRKAHVLRYEMTAARGRAERAAAAPAETEPTALPAAPAAAVASAPAAALFAPPPAGSVESSRVESTGPAAGVVPDRDHVVPTRVESPEAAYPRVPAAGEVVPEAVPARDQVVPERAATAPAARVAVSSRVESAGPAPGSATALHPDVLRSAPSGVPEQPAAPAAEATAEGVAEAVDELGRLRLALAGERTSRSPLARGLGAPTGTWSAENATLLVEGWEADPGVFAVRDLGRRLVGWVEEVREGRQGRNGWGTFIDGRLVIDADDGQPVLAAEPQYALSLLHVALSRRLV
ncbi:hypothetical protein [Kitasatospora sp. NPDC050543]|uniref:hypothetical protein n=1 Tax=Kitasatospora sp. NPDC050543 TaxID=3364054 RepID=UPI00379973F9